MTNILNNKYLVILILATIIFLLRLPSLEEPFDNDSGANAYHARLILQGEPLYSTHHPAHHLPGVYYTYALSFLVLGDDTWSVKFFLIPWTIATAYIIYLIGSKLDDYKTGFWASVFYALLNSHIILKGTTAETELFANLPISATILLGVHLLKEKKDSWFFLFVGVLGGISFVYKSVFLYPLAVVFFMILVNSYQTSKADHGWKEIIQPTLWIGFGFIITLTVIIGLFAKLGLLSRLLLVFKLGQGYVSEMSSLTSLLTILLLPISILAFANIILLVLSLAGSIRIIRHIHKKYWTRRNFPVVGCGILLWYLLSVTVAGLTRLGFGHYSIITIPPLAILAAWELGQLQKLTMSQHVFIKKPLSPILGVLVLIMVLFSSGITNYKLYTYYLQYKLGNVSYETFLTKGAYTTGPDAIKALHIANYIKDHTTPDDLVYSWSDYAQIYYLADRRSALDTLWPYYVEATGSYLRIFSPRTKYIIVGESVMAPKPEWLYTEINRTYKLEAIIDDQEIYSRIN